MGTYVSAEIKAGGLGTAGVFESEGEALKSSTLEDEETKEVSYTQNFSTSGGEDTVVLSTVAYDAYAYTAYYQGADGSQTNSPYIVYVPRNGSDSIKIASLNYEDYLEFIPYAKGALPDMSNVFTHTPGKPETYPNKAPSGINVVTNSVMTYPKTAGFPSNTGSQTLSIDITEETSQVTSSGSSVSAKLGGGPEVSRTRKPSSLAPKPVKNAAVKPGNAAIQLFGEQEDGVSMKYKVDGERYWWTYSRGYKTTGYENGKTYTVAIATEGRDEYGFTLRTTQYLTVTPDASIPDKPSYPIIDAFIGDDYIRLE